MTEPYLDPNKRDEVIDSYNIWETPPEAMFDSIASLAARLLDCPVGFFALVNSTSWWLKAGYGLNQMCVPREQTLCSHVVTRAQKVVIRNAEEDPEWCDHAAVTGEFGLRAYVGIPVIGYGGMVVGTLCVLDMRPHDFSDEEIESLEALALQIESHLQARRRVANLEHRLAETGMVSRDEIAHVARRQIEINKRVLHDFRNVLAAIQANVEFLRDCPDELTDEVVLDVHEACTRGMGIVEELEDFAISHYELASELVHDTEVEVVAQ